MSYGDRSIQKSKHTGALRGKHAGAENYYFLTVIVIDFQVPL